MRHQRTHLTRLALAIAMTGVLFGCGFGGTSNGLGSVSDDDSDRETPNAPTLSAVLPATGPLAGGTELTLTGTGFEASGVGLIVVRIGGNNTAPPVVVDDSTMVVGLPPGTAGSVDIEVVTNNGPAVLPEGFTYVAERTRLLAADGKDGVPGQLYEVDAATAAAIPIGSVGFAVNGLAVSPTGDLIATEATDFAVLGHPRLLQIDPFSGAGRVIGELEDSSRQFVHAEVPDISFAGSRLIGWSEHGDVPIEINASTGRVTILGPTLRSDGDGVAAADAATLHLTPERNDGGRLFHLDAVSGATAPNVALTGSSIVDGRIVAMTYFQGTLYGVLRDNGEVAPVDTSFLVVINPSTGTVTEVGRLPDGVTALSEGP